MGRVVVFFVQDYLMSEAKEVTERSTAISVGSLGSKSDFELGNRCP